MDFFLLQQYEAFITNVNNAFKDRKEPLMSEMNELFKSNNYHSDTMKLLLQKLSASKNQDTNIKIYKKMEDLRSAGLDLSPEATELKKESDILQKEQTQWVYNYIAENPTEVSFYLLISDLISLRENKDISILKELFEILSKRNSEHPYIEVAADLIRSMENIRVGGKYIDFELPDMEGNKHTLSELIDNQIALIDLWATWCGPCIATSKSMIPVYEDYKDTGFTIVGVAGEINNTDRLSAMLERLGFPWITLVELDHQHGIWNKYGRSNSGGGTFLVDREGKILAIDPSAEEVRSTLDELLN